MLVTFMNQEMFSATKLEIANTSAKKKNNGHTSGKKISKGKEKRLTQEGVQYLQQSNPRLMSRNGEDFLA